jgi:hypothetical protein
MSIANGIEHQAVLIAQDLLLLVVGKASFRHLLCVRGGSFPHAAAAHENLSLQQQLTFTGFTLHVEDRVIVLYVGIETENHDELLL